MSTTAAFVNSFKQQLLAMTPHTAADVYKIALYTSAGATLSATTTVYTTTGEITGPGYTAGGATLAGFTAGLYSNTGTLDWTTNPTWATATITADTALIYNSTRSNAAVAVLTFTSASSTAATFTVQMPTPAAATSLVRIA